MVWFQWVPGREGRAPARSGAGTGAGMQWWLPRRSQGCSAVTFGARGDGICSEHAPISVGLCKAGVVPLLLVHRWPCEGPHCVACSAESSWLQGICAVSVRVQASAWGCTVAYRSWAAVLMIRPCRVSISSRHSGIADDKAAQSHVQSAGWRAALAWPRSPPVPVAGCVHILPPGMGRLDVDARCTPAP